jgi:HlyD family secretion protein
MDGTILELNHKVGERIRGSDFSEDVVLLMGGLADMEIKAEVGEHEVVGIHVGNEATIEIDAIPDKQFKGHVVAVGKNAQIKNPGTDAEVTTFFVRVGLDVPPEGALPGMSSAVSISTATHDNVVMVPIQAVTSREAKKKEQKAAPREGEIKVADTTTTASTTAGSATVASNGKDDPPTKAATGKPKPVKVVFVVDKDGVAQMREVQTGIASRTDVEILTGVNEGETVVDGPYRTLARELQEGQKVKPQKPGQGSGKQGPQGGRS